MDDENTIEVPIWFFDLTAALIGWLVGYYVLPSLIGNQLLQLLSR